MARSRATGERLRGIGILLAAVLVTAPAGAERPGGLERSSARLAATDLVGLLAGAIADAREACSARPAGCGAKAPVAPAAEASATGAAAAAQPAPATGACRTRSRGCATIQPAEPVRIDLRDYIHQGFAGGQRESDPVQWHGEGTLRVLRCRPEDCDASCTSTPGGGGPLLEPFFHKQYVLDRTGGWLCADGATPTVHNMKSPEGAPIEYACTDQSDILLIWETSPFIGCEFRPEGNPRLFFRDDGAVQEGMLWTPVVAESGALIPNRIRETRFQCGAQGDLTESSRGESVSFIRILGPYDVSTPAARRRTLNEWRLRFIVPPDVPDTEALPEAWHEGFPRDVGRAGAPVEIVIRRDYLDIQNDDFRTRDLVEHYFYGVVDRGGLGQFGTGLIRWNFASLEDRTFYRQGTVTRLVEEATDRGLLGRDLCEQ